jgi:hypothetical protein
MGEAVVIYAFLLIEIVFTNVVRFCQNKREMFLDVRVLIKQG